MQTDINDCELLNQLYQCHVTIVHRAILSAPDPAQLQCETNVIIEDIIYQGATIKDYPICGITYLPIGFEDDTFVGSYCFYKNINNQKVCFNQRAIEALSNNSASDIFLCPYSRIPLVTEQAFLKKVENRRIQQAFDSDSILVSIKDGKKIYTIEDTDAFIRNCHTLKIHNVEHLIFHRNLYRIKKVPSEIGQLTSLRVLHLENNYIKELPSEISGLINLDRKSVV